MKLSGRTYSLLVVGFAGLLATGVDACQRAVLDNHKMSPQQKQKILDLHNSKRQAVANGQVPGQPPAGNMLELKWDEELAARAQAWASSCRSEEHDPQRKTKRFHMGQNIATFWTSKVPLSFQEAAPEFDTAISRWFDEKQGYKYGKISGFQSTGHYTQMVWAKTYLIGCGFALYYDRSRGYIKNYVCNYGPAGNILSRTPYENGPPSCQNYKLDFSRKWQGLCDQPTNYNGHSYNLIPYK